MNVAAWVLLGAIAAVASLLAILANGSTGLTLFLVAVAVAAAALLLLGVVEQTRWPAWSPPSSPVGDPEGVRFSFQTGVRGRYPLALLLDSLERREGNPNLGVETQEEVDRLHAMTVEEFRRYVRDRVRDIESRT